MEALNGKSLADVMNRCHQYAKYQAAILFQTSEQMSEFVKSIRAALADNEYGIESLSRAGTVRFTNGSIIRPYAAGTARQKPVHVNEALLSGGCHWIPEFLRFEIYHCEEETERDEESLDNFLGSFKVYEA